ncbi:hypothetical protein C5E46_19755 [Nocardia nova]|nr:hypothetical protein C5E46_19755 [Nocardia nova]
MHNMSFVTMVENLVAGEHLEKNPWTPDAMWHNIANQAIEALVARGLLSRPDADIVTGVMPLEELPQFIGCPDASPIWRAIYMAYRLAMGRAFNDTKYEVRNIMARRAVTTKQFSFMLGVLADRDVRGPKSQRESGSRRPPTLQTARNAFGDGGFLAYDIPGGSWEPVYKSPTDLLQLALSGNKNARITLLIGGGYALIMDGYLTRDRESKFFEGTTPYRATPPNLLTDLAHREHGLRILATAWMSWKADEAAHCYDIPDIDEDGKPVIEGATLDTRRPRRLTEGRLFEIANPAKAMSGFLEQQEMRSRKNRAESPEEHDRQYRERLATALDIAKDAATHLKASKVTPPPGPFGTYEEWKRQKEIARGIFEILVASEPVETFFASKMPEDDSDESDPDLS